jgi:hypothetical protein
MGQRPTPLNTGKAGGRWPRPGCLGLPGDSRNRVRSEPVDAGVVWALRRLAGR